MLSHAPFFDKLAVIADEADPEWKATAAGLVVLRLVDDWLDFGPHVVSTDITGLAAVRDAIERVDEGNPTRRLLHQIVASMEQAEVASAQAVVPALLAYAQALQYSSDAPLERDVLLTLRKYAESVNDPQTIVHSSLRLGVVNRALGDYTEAEFYHKEAERSAAEIGETASVFLARLGLAKTAAARGNLPFADALCSSVIDEARHKGLSRILAIGLNDRAHISILRKDYQNAVRSAYAALEFAISEGDRDRVMADLAAAFLRLGHISAARDTNLILASSAQEQSVRWQATVNLMYAAAQEHQEAAFDLYKATLEMTVLPPYVEVYYYRISAVGLRIFGHLDEAESALRQAHAVAEKHHMQQFVFELEEELKELEKQTTTMWEKDIDVIADTIGEQLQFRSYARAR